MQLPTFDGILLAAAGAGLLLVLLVIVAGWRMFQRRPPAATPRELDLRLPVAELGPEGPEGLAPRLELYGTPVRLAGVVLAPVGRDGEIPDKELLPDLLEQLIPHMLDVVAGHGPQLRFWPPQFSTQGFAHAFFQNAALPGNRGKGTPWCSVAGKFSAYGRQYLAGVVCRADRPNALGELLMEHEGQWNDVLRVRN